MSKNNFSDWLSKQKTSKKEISFEEQFKSLQKEEDLKKEFQDRLKKKKKKNR